jgi:hypothetical protein
MQLVGSGIRAVCHEIRAAPRAVVRGGFQRGLGLPEEGIVERRACLFLSHTAAMVGTKIAVDKLQMQNANNNAKYVVSILQGVLEFKLKHGRTYEEQRSIEGMIGRRAGGTNRKARII